MHSSKLKWEMREIIIMFGLQDHCYFSLFVHFGLVVNDYQWIQSISIVATYWRVCGCKKTFHLPWSEPTLCRSVSISPVTATFLGSKNILPDLVFWLQLIQLSVNITFFSLSERRAGSFGEILRHSVSAGSWSRIHCMLLLNDGTATNIMFCVRRKAGDESTFLLLLHHDGGHTYVGMC